MTDINWGVLQPLEQIAPTQSAQPIAKKAILPQSSGNGAQSSGGDVGGLLGGIGDALKGLFGKNPVSIANDALTNQMSQMPQADLANSLIRSPIQSPGQQYQASPSVQQTNQALSIPNIQSMAAQTFPDNPIMQRVATTQAIEESGLLGGHPSRLASQNNNLFGISGHDVTMNNKSGNDLHSYAEYDSPLASFNAYRNLMNNPRYAAVRNAKTPQEAFQALQQAGYATDPNYAQNLNNIYNETSQTNAIHRAVTASSMPGATPYDIATSYMGKGSNNHPEVLQQFFDKSMGENVDPRTTPWCAAFANSVLMTTGHGGTGSLAARSFLNYGRPTDNPTKGDVVVMSNLSKGNDPSKGHVGFFAGYNQDRSRVKVLGGNESGQVMIKEYPVSKVIGYRVPPTPQELKMRATEPYKGELKTSMRNPEQNKFVNQDEIAPPEIPQEQYEEEVKDLDQGLDDYE